MTGTSPRPAHTVDPVRLVAAHAAAIDFYRHHLLADATARAYLHHRGLAAFARRDLPWKLGVDLPWRIGYAPAAWTTLTDHLTRLGYSGAELITAGLARTSANGRRIYDTFRDRIMFPIRDTNGNPVGFTARALHPTDKAPKYLNTPQTTIFHKGQMWYGLAEQHDRLAAGAPPVIVEGPLDVLAVWLVHPDHAGLPRVALATCGTSLSPQHVAALTALAGAHRHGITTCYDNDPAGIAATERVWTLLHSNHAFDLRAAVLPTGSDPADLLTRPGGTAALREALAHRARPLVEAVIDHRLDSFVARHADRPDSPELRVAAVRTIVDLFTHVPREDAGRVVRRVANITGAAVETVTSAVIGALNDADPEAPTPTAQPPPARTAATQAFPPPDAVAHRPPGRPSHPINPAALRRHRPSRR